MERKADALFTAIQSSVDDRAFDVSSTVRQVRLAVDTAACQVSSDLKHRPRASSRSPSTRIIPVMSRSHLIGNMLEPTGASGRPMTPPQQFSPRASFPNKHAEQQQPSTGATSLNNPVLASPATHCFADYFQARKSGAAADAFYSRQPTSKSLDARSGYSSQPSRKSPNAPSYYNAEPCSPSGLKSVLARLEQVRPTTVVLQQMKSAADASCTQRLQLSSGHSTAEGQQHYGAPGRSPLPVNIKPTAAQAYVPGTLKGSAGSDLPSLLAPMSDRRPWSGAESPVRPVSPQNMLVLRTLALHTPHNIVPPALQDRASSPLAGQTTQSCAPHSPRHGQSSSWCQAVCSTGALSVRLPGSPLHHLICHGCNQMHAMQQHQSCCHRCCSCCNCNATAAGSQQQAPTAEPSTESSYACSCPCIRAYKQGHRDAQKAAGVQAGSPRGSDLAAGLQDTMAALKLTDTAVANAIAHATGNTAAAAAATAAAATGMEGSGFGEVNETESLMEVLRQLAAAQEELLNQGPPFDANQLGEVADQLAECVANSQPQHEQLLRQVLEQQQQLLAVQQRALLDSTSGAGGQAPQLQQLQFQQQHQQPGWGELDALELPQEGDAAAEAIDDSEARARTGSWVVQHQVQQPQQQGRGDTYPPVNKQYPGKTAGMGFEQVVRPGLEQGFERPLAARLPAGASISSPKVPITQPNSNAFSAVDKIMSAGMSEEDQLAAAAAAYTAVPEAVKPAVQHGSYSRTDSNCQAGKHSSYIGRGTQWQQGPAPALTLEELAEAMAIGQSFPAQQQHQQPYSNDRGSNNSNNRKNKARAARSKLPGMEEIESVIAAYNAAGVFAGQHSEQKQHGEPLVHFMMTPQQTSGAGGDSWTGGSVLRQGPPQVTAVAQLVRISSASSRLLSGAGQSTRPSGTAAGEGAGISPSSRSIADSAWSVLANGANAAAAATAMHQSPRVLNSPIGRASPPATAQQVVNSPGAAAQQHHHWAQRQQSRSEADAPHSAPTLSTPLAPDPGQGPSKQQYLSSSAAAAVSMEAVTASLNPASAAQLHSRAGHGGDYLESQLSRLSSVRQGGSSPGTNACTPRGSRLAAAPGGPLSASGAQSQRPSVRFIDEQCPHAAAESPYPDQPGAAARVSNEAVVSAQLEPQQAAELFMPLEGHDQQQQQPRSVVAARAGSFQAPDSEVSSAAASARPSASQVSLQQKQQHQHMAAGGQGLAAAAAAAQQASAATWSRSVSTAPARQSSTSAGDHMPVTISNWNTAASTSASPGSPESKSSSTLSAIAFSNAGTASRASHSSDVSGLTKMQSQKHPYHSADLEQLASPVASVPVSTRSSFMQHLPPASAMQQQQPTPQSNDSIAKRAQGDGSNRSVAATPAVSAPVSSSGSAASWKQQQLLMQQQLAAQQQQLKQIQSLGNSVVNSPRSSRGPFSRSTTVGRSSMINATAAGTAAAVRMPSVSGSPGSGSMVMAATSLSENVAAAAKSPSGWASEQPAANKQLPMQVTHAELSGAPSRVEHAPSSRSFEGKLNFGSQHEDGLPAPPAAATSAAAFLGSSDEEFEEEVGSQIGQAMLHNVLYEKLLLRRKGRLMQKALSTWWRYTFPVRTLTQASAPSRRRSSSTQDDESGQLAVSLTFPGPQGLQQELAAAVQGQGNMPEGMDFVISGQVRLQCSPARQRPQSAGVLGVAPDAATGSAAEVLTCRSDRKRWGSPDTAAARATAALAVAASRSPDRCRSIGKAAAAAAEQAAADAFAAQAKPLQAALREVHSMVAAMENICETGGSAMSSNAGSNRPLTHKIAPGVAAAVVKACRGTSGDGRQLRQQQQRSPTSQCSAVGRTRQQQQQQEQQQRQHQAAVRSADKYKLRGQLHHVQDRLTKLEVKMIQAASMQEGPCFCNSAADSMSRTRSPTSCSPQPRLVSMDFVQHDEQCGGRGAKCKGGCVTRVAAKRQALVGRMQDEIGQLQQELAELRLMMPGAYV